MPSVKPFKGILYNPARVNVSNVVAPPYDVISPQEQQSLYERDSHNVVRLVLNREANPYVAAGREYLSWLEEGSLSQDRLPAMYIHAQSFSDPEGRPVERWGFMAACKLEEFGKGSIYPHEKTLSGPREDRFRLFQATNAMFSQIFGLYSDPQHELDDSIRSVLNEQPVLDLNYDGVRNRLWRLSDERHESAIVSFLTGQKVLIADGHHRYETALLYRDARRLKNPGHLGTEPYNFVPMFFTNMHDPGLIIYPTHRLVHSLPGFAQEAFIESCRKYFSVAESGSTEALVRELKSHAKGAIGLFLADPDKWYLLRARERAVNEEMRATPPALAELDVSLLHIIIMKTILGMSDEAQEKKLHLRYEKDAGQAIASVQRGKSQAAFLMNPTRIEQVRGVASSGMVMPQKSTYFYPKILSGLVIYSFDERG